MTTHIGIRARFELQLPPSISGQHTSVNRRGGLSPVSRKHKAGAEEAIRPLRAEDAICGTLNVSDHPVVDVHLVKGFDPLRPCSEVHWRRYWTRNLAQEHLLRSP